MEILNVIKNKLIFLAATVSLVSSAAVFSADFGMTAGNKSADAKKVASKVVKVPVKAKKKHTKHFTKATSIDARTKALEAEVKNLKGKVADLNKQQEQSKSSSSWNNLYAYGPAIVTTPIIGEPDYVGYDLYINMPSINEDMALLQFNQKLANHYAENNIDLPSRPVLALSGEIEGQVLNSSSFNDSSRSDVNLSVVALEAVANINKWITGVIKVEYSDKPPATGARVSNSDLKVKRGYVTVGNLNECPVYMTIGQMYVPFGVYNGWSISDPLTKTLGRTQERAVVLGFNKSGAYGSLYAFEGDSYTGGGNSINSWGANLGYKFVENKWSLDVGAGYIANIADSLGMQDTGFSSNGTNRTFVGFKNHEKLVKQVAAADAHLLFMYDPVWIAAEYITALNDFDKKDLTFNGSGARPKALDIEGIYNFTFLSKPSFVSAGFGKSWDAMALDMAKYSYFVSTGISMFKNTVQSIEYRHDINYNDTDVSTSGHYVFVPDHKHRNVITASFKLFF